MNDGFSPSISPGLRLHLVRARALVLWLQENGPRNISATKRFRIAGALFSIAFDHHVGVLALFSEDLKSPAFGLARSVWEAYVSGMWVRHIGKESLVERLVQGTYAIKLESAVQKLKDVPEFVGGAAFHQHTWPVLCNYAHGGPLQIQRWITGDTVEPVHSDEEILEILRISNRVAFLSTVSMLDMAEMDATAFNDKTLEMNASNWL